jgi:peroxiredoxin
METDITLEQAPDFEALDLLGRTLRLQDYRGTRHIVLVFNRGFF